MSVIKSDFEKQWQGWKITPEQIEKIKQNDREAIDKFYFDNYSRFSLMAKGYAIKRQNMGLGQFCAEDMLQNLYIDLPVLNYDTSGKFVSSAFNSFYWVLFGGQWQIKSTLRASKAARASYFPLYIIDKGCYRSDDSVSDGQDDYREIDKFVSSPSAYHEYFYQKEQRRQEKLEADLIPFLSQIFNQKQLEAWEAGRDNASIRKTLQKNADRVIDFLQKHGTPKKRLQGKVINEDEIKAQREAYKKWEEEHLDELLPSHRERVKKRLVSRKMYENRKKALKN